MACQRCESFHVWELCCRELQVGFLGTDRVCGEGCIGVCMHLYAYIQTHLCFLSAFKYVHIGIQPPICAELQLQDSCNLASISCCPNTRGGQGLIKNATNMFKMERSNKEGKKMRTIWQDYINYNGDYINYTPSMVFLNCLKTCLIGDAGCPSAITPYNCSLADGCHSTERSWGMIWKRRFPLDLFQRVHFL